MTNHLDRNTMPYRTRQAPNFRFLWTVLLGLFTISSTQLFAAACKDIPMSAGMRIAKPQPDLNDPCHYSNFVQDMLRQEKWDDLDAFISRDRSLKTRFPGGGWKLASAYTALAYPLQMDESQRLTEEEWHAHAAKLAAWVAARPDSITARVALAKFYVDYAWRARGPEYADLVGVDAMKLFDQRVANARDILAAAFKLPAKCPEWYEIMLEIARAQGWELSQQESLLEAAYRFEPLYYYYYKEHAWALQPQWYGEPGDSADFAAEIANRIGGKQGDIVYFEIAITVGCRGCAEAQPPSHSMSWERIRKGYAAEVELYGVGPYKLNSFAKLALSANDPYLAASLFLEIGSHGMDEVWGSKRIFVSQKQSAFSMPPELFEKFDLSVKNYNKPGGKGYMTQFENDFHSRLDSAVKSCTESVHRDDGYFTIFVQLGAKGDVEKAIAWPPTNVSTCLMPKFSRQAFTAPPEPGYWTYVNVGEEKPTIFAYFGATVPDIGR